MSKHFYYVQRNFAEGYCDFKLIDGSTGANANQIVGYCHSNLHNGYITKALFKKHDCLEKNCNSFEKLSEYPYWQSVDAIEKRRLFDKEIKRLSIQAQRAEEEHLQQMKVCAQNIANLLCYPIVITNIRKAERSEGCNFMVNYVSNKRKNDYREYLKLLQSLYEVYKKKFSLCKIRNIDGSFPTIEEYIEISENIAG